MPAFVVDASVALAWVLPPGDVAAVTALYAEAARAGIAAPAIWPLEVANVLLRRERANLLRRPDRLAALAALARLRPAIDDSATAFPFPAGDALAERHGLTTYDAAYLELAMRLALPLATLDTALRRAATAEAVPLLPD